MKKLIALLLTLAMIFSLSACASGDSEQDETEANAETAPITDDGADDTRLPDDTQAVDDHSTDDDPGEVDPDESAAEEPDNTGVPEDEDDSISEAPSDGAVSNPVSTGTGNTTAGETNNADSPVTSGESEISTPDSPSEGTDNGSADAEGNDVTTGEALKAQFTEIMESGESYSMESLAQALIENPVIKFSGITMEVTEGYLSGFSEEIYGFSEGYMFCPMIGSIAFVGYVFYIDDSADVQSFVETLESCADPRWNICVTANEMVISTYDNTVFFVMCP